jgi:hypothetical protein
MPVPIWIQFLETKTKYYRFKAKKIIYLQRLIEKKYVFHHSKVSHTLLIEND